MKWETVKLGDVCTFKTGKTPSTKKIEYFNGSINWYTPGDIGASKFLTQSVRTITDLAIKENQAALLPLNTLLVTCIGEIGRVGILSKPASSNQQITGLTFDKRVLPKYAYYWFMFNRNVLKDRSNNAVVPILNNAALREITFKYPPLHIQEQIADTLDKADALRRKDQELLNKYDQLAQAIFYDMFGNPVRNERMWITAKLTNCVIGKAGIKAGPFGSSLKKEFYTKVGYKIYGQEQVISDDLDSGNYFISEEKYKELESCKVEAGDVLISMVGTYGKISVVPEKFQPGIINPRLVKLTLNKSILLPDFFKFVFKLPETKESLSMVSRGGTMDILNAGILKEFITILPPILLQQIFLYKLNNLKQSISKVSLQQTNAFYNGLMNHIFS